MRNRNIAFAAVGHGSVRDAAVSIIRDAARYVADHAEDLVARADSDEVTTSDGIDVTIHVKTVDEAPTIEIRREMFVLRQIGGEQSSTIPSRAADMTE